MKIHQLKIEYKYYREVKIGRKNFEIRKDDRDYQKGDLVTFMCGSEVKGWNETLDVYQITYILRNAPQHGLKEGFCILSLVKLVEKEKGRR